ncbi:unnamed protein product [Schistosoma rodhaini]|uniref:Uncharacterized protein n=1 Tax=Schistosoma rodhaini TaxID=6188 RepID=A0AA85FWY4_9TREM|nr:unnamed protein product [Schistosoma rodhaini]
MIGILSSRSNMQKYFLVHSNDYKLDTNTQIEAHTHYLFFSIRSHFIGLFVFSGGFIQNSIVLELVTQKIFLK